MWPLSRKTCVNGGLVMRIRKLGVVGAGTMGSGIAALAASAGIPVVLLDIPAPEGDRNAIVKGGLERAKKARPAAFMETTRATAVTTGNTDDNLVMLADCDLVIEAIIEQVEPKRALYEKLETLLPAHAIVASNTSGIPMQSLLEGRSAAFRSRFLGMHFFNPPRYLHLLEIIPTADTSPETLAAATRFSDRILGKGIVLAKDVPGFVANRLGVYGMVLAIELTEKYDLTIDEADLLTGALLGRSKSATYRTADLSGIDVIGHVTAGLSQSTGEKFTLSKWVLELIKAGRVGEKSGAGFYRKEGKEITTLDWKTGEYRPQSKPSDPELSKLAKLPHATRFAALREWKGKYGDFAREYLLRFSHYVLRTSPVIAYDIPAVDHAMEWGYAWELGPFRQMDLLGVDFLRDGFAKLGLDVPPLLTRAVSGFYKPGAESSVLSIDGSGYAPVPVDRDVFSLALVRNASGHSNNPRLASSDAATVWDAGGVAIVEFHSKMNSLGKGAIEMMHRALDLVDEKGLAGLVIGNEDPRTFTAGADLTMIAGLIQAGDWKAMESAVRVFQETSMRLRTSPFPVVAAPFGLTLGGGCEFSLHADHVQAHAELYMGLVEVGVGLIPAGGGTKELLFRFSSAFAPYAEADAFDGVKRAFQLIAMGTTSTSALEAKSLGYLRERDRVTMNRERLLSDAIARVKDLAPDYVAPLPRTTIALGKEAMGNLQYGIWAMHEAGQITEFETRLARELAYVLAGGDGPARVVTEQDILDLEREAFLKLLGTKETQARIEHMLKTGKPLRN
jgi:3-hydroxyacyl-CoA dehydrogenase